MKTNLTISLTETNKPDGIHLANLSPDDVELIFEGRTSLSDTGHDEDLNYQLTSKRLNSGTYVNMTNDAKGGYYVPLYSPDSNVAEGNYKIASIYSVWDGSIESNSLQVMVLQGTSTQTYIMNDHKVCLGSQEYDVKTIAWAPDSSNLAFVYEKDYGKYYICTWDYDDAKVTCLSSVFGSVPGNLVWSPDKKYIYFNMHYSNADTTAWGIYRIQVSRGFFSSFGSSSSGYKQYTNNPYYHYYPFTLSADGKRIYAVRAQSEPVIYKSDAGVESGGCDKPIVSIDVNSDVISDYLPSSTTDPEAPCYWTIAKTLHEDYLIVGTYDDARAFQLSTFKVSDKSLSQVTGLTKDDWIDEYTVGKDKLVYLQNYFNGEPANNKLTTVNLNISSSTTSGESGSDTSDASETTTDTGTDTVVADGDAVGPTIDTGLGEPSSGEETGAETSGDSSSDGTSGEEGSAESDAGSGDGGQGCGCMISGHDPIQGGLDALPFILLLILPMVYRRSRPVAGTHQ